LSTSSHNNNKFAIEERRRHVASLLAKHKTQTEIGRLLGYDQTTISDDIKALKVMSQHFIYDLAKSDLGFYYKQCLDGIDEAKKEAWRIHDRYAESNYTDHHKLRLAALKVVIQAEEAKFKLLSEGPNVLSVNKMSERLESIESHFQETHR
jgi:hypothetical protein